MRAREENIREIDEIKFAVTAVIVVCHVQAAVPSEAFSQLSRLRQPQPCWIRSAAPRTSIAS